MAFMGADASTTGPTGGHGIAQYMCCRNRQTPYRSCHSSHVSFDATAKVELLAKERGRPALRLLVGGIFPDLTLHLRSSSEISASISSISRRWLSMI
jgi:hypothetical protein